MPELQSMQEYKDFFDESIIKIEIIDDFLLISEIAPKEFALAAKKAGYKKGDFIELLKSSIAPVNHQQK